MSPPGVGALLKKLKERFSFLGASGDTLGQFSASSAVADGARAHEPSVIREEAEETASGLPPLIIDAERLARSVAAGVHGRRRAGPGETFWQHRPYAFGDAVSMIDWRQSARAASHLYVRQNEWEAAAAVWLWRDPSRSLDYASTPASPTKRRRADVLALALAMLLSEGGERIGLMGARPRPFHGRTAPTMFLDALKTDQFDDETAPPPIAAGPGTMVILISDFFCDLAPIAQAVNRLAAQGAQGLLLQVLDPAETAFPFSGRTEFLDLESADRLTFGAAQSIAEQYRSALGALQADLLALSRAAGWITQHHQTDASAAQALLTLYEALSSQKGG